jgi:arginyl-tRNA--protein-N-Asp/Glu arginylyltransferase
MYERILKQMRERIRTRKYVMTFHAEEEMADDNLSIFDIERAVLTGKIVKRQKDKSTKEWKYIVEGKIISTSMAVVVGKLSITGKLVIITVYKI